jgi:hypothetical protein
MRIIFINLILIGILNTVFTQTTFEYLHQTTSDERPVNMIEDDSGNIDLYVADLEVISVENGQAQLQFETLAGSIDPFVDCNVNSTDYWKAANNAGKCSIYEYQYLGQDAASRINVLLNCVQLNVGYLLQNF